MAKIVQRATEARVSPGRILSSRRQFFGDLGHTPVWVTVNNVNADFADASGNSICNPGQPFVTDQRGTSSFFAAWRPDRVFAAGQGRQPGAPPLGLRGGIAIWRSQLGLGGKVLELLGRLLAGSHPSCRTSEYQSILCCLAALRVFAAGHGRQPGAPPLGLRGGIAIWRSQLLDSGADPGAVRSTIGWVTCYVSDRSSARGSARGRRHRLWRRRSLGGEEPERQRHGHGAT